MLRRAAQVSRGACKMLVLSCPPYTPRLLAGVTMEDRVQSSFADGNRFYTLLEGLSRATDIQERRFPARNFILESAIPPSRAEGYLRYAVTLTLDPGGDAGTDHFNLKTCHDEYVEKELCDGLRSHEFSPFASDCPATFRPGLALEELPGVGDDCWLVRVEEFSFIADRISDRIEATKLWALLAEVSEGERAVRHDHARRADCDEYLLRWQEDIDNRPIFSAFWDDARDVLQDLQPGWADEVRDRLGLLHHHPTTRRPEVRVVVFRYPARLVPRSSSGRRLLLRPTVLDGTINQAFYTSPPEAKDGATMDLKARDDRPWREVVHPALEFRAEHVWATGIIDSGVRASLGGARGHHAKKLCRGASEDFTKLCYAIDGDLI